MVAEKRLILSALVLGALCLASFYVILGRSPQLERSGEDIFRAFCRSCHTSRIIKAPNIGDSQAWKARISQGDDILLDHVVKGYRGMPPKGTCSNCSIEELKKTISYIVSKSR
ncbi:MAG: c-type cytochrome [bacterium]|nr:c-type cytochrome [bacterium]